jgi:protein phosphatase
LLAKLGYSVRLEGTGDDRRAITTAPKGRRAFFVGDLVDRGPNSPDVLRIVVDMAERGQAFSVIGNHDDKFRRYLKGRDVKLAHGLERTVEQYAGEGEALRTRTLAFLETLPSHAWVDGCTISRSMVIPRAAWTQPVCPNASTGRPTTTARRRWSTDTRRSPNRSG